MRTVKLLVGFQFLVQNKIKNLNIFYVNSRPTKADELIVDTIQTLLSYLAYIGFLGTGMIFVFKFLRDRRKMTGLKSISHSQAKLAMLRLTFKSKIKKKAMQFRASFKKAIPKGEVVDLALDEMIGLKFETGDEFQQYFDICKKVNVFLKADMAADGPSAAAAPAVGESAQIFEDFMSTDFKNELAIIRLIKEMTEVSTDLNKKIEAYNNLNLQKPVPKVDSLYFVSLIDVNKVFDNEDANAESTLSKVA